MLELRILTGLHRGAALPLEGEAIQIGSASENDIVLADPGMPAVAGVVQRSGQSSWVYRSGNEIEIGRQASRSGSSASEMAITAGARWFAGPVLIGCEDEHTCWGAEPARPSAPSRVKRPVSLRAKVGALSVSVLALAIGVALLLVGKPLIVMSTMQSLAGDSAVAPQRAKSVDEAAVRGVDSRLVAATGPRPGAAFASASEPPRPPTRTVTAAVYPTHTSQPPPFAIRSASGGPYGFVVTDDGHVLMPGSRWQSFTLVRIEPGRAVFAGPYAAELTW
jgi:type III secretion protein D